jgi:hypothetical protein
MRQHITFASAVLFILAVPGPLSAAQTASAPEVQARTARPHFAARVRAGVRAGQLTREEVAQFRRHLRAFRHRAQDLRLDGLTPEERTELRRGLGRLNRHLYRLRHR